MKSIAFKIVDRSAGRDANAGKNLTIRFNEVTFMKYISRRIQSASTAPYREDEDGDGRIEVTLFFSTRKHELNLFNSTRPALTRPLFFPLVVAVWLRKTGQL